MRKAAHRRACSISCRGSPRWPVARRIKTRVLNLRGRRGGCWNALPDWRMAAQPEVRLRGQRLLRLYALQFAADPVSGSAADANSRPGLAEPAARLAKITAE